MSRALRVAFALLPAFSGLAGAQMEPPLDVREYLSSRGAFVVPDEVALVPPADGGPSARRDLGIVLEAFRVPVRARSGRGVAVLAAEDADSIGAEDAAVQVGATDSPVVRSGTSLLRVVPLRQVVFRLREGGNLAAVESDLKALSAAPAVQRRDREYTARPAGDGGRWWSLGAAARLASHPLVEWAVPDCIREFRRSYVPNDIAGLWHLRNTNTVAHTNDLAVPPAWDTTLGSPSALIAILDDGFDIGHPDLAANVWTNPLETAGDGLDNDGNGYVDDVNGWNFVAGTNAVTPADPEDSHGTALAGLAVARADNGQGVAGVCPLCRLLPAKIIQGTSFVTDSEWAEAVHYARRYARVISLSITTSQALEEQLVAAFDQAATSCLVVASSGNEADEGVYLWDCDNNIETYGWTSFSQYVGAAGSHVFRWTYDKDSMESGPSDCAWIDAVRLPDGQWFDFESGSLPSGWTTGGDASWFASPESNDHMVVGAYSMRSGDVGDNEQSWLQVSADGPGAVTFYYQVFGERTCDGELVPVNWDNLYFEVDGYLVLDDATEDPVWWGMDFTNVAFPAALTSVVAIGASTIDGFRATYSCFGTNSEVLTASGGSAGEDPLRTTDRRGADGYSPTDYYDGFSGTSPSAALAAGIAGLLFSANPHLTPFQARELLRQSARKIGTIPYTDGFNPRYGYGQADAAAAMRLMLSNMPPEMTGMETMSNQVRFALVGIESNRLYDVYGASALAPGTQDWHKLNVTNLYGHPVFGVNETPFFDRGPTLRVFRVVK